jgi:3-deoxy-manno-octulosonate cytidylyltransferase (CMP-KDO synthetase)
MCNDRVVEATKKIEKIKRIKYDFIVNIQGDLPMIYPDMISSLLKPLIDDKKIETSTMAEEIIDKREFYDRNRVKVIFDKKDDAILLTREPVPSDFKFKGKYKKYKHVAIRAYRRDIFERISKLKLSPIEEIEGIDDIRLLENNIKIRVMFTSKITETVDNKKDLLKVKSMMKKDPLLKKYKKKFEN